MKLKSTLILLFLTFNIWQTEAQTTVTIGTQTGQASTNVLLSTSTTINRYSRTMSVYTASEIALAGGSAGAISSLAWSKNGVGEYTFGDAYIKVFMKHVSNTTWTNAPVPSWDTEVLGATEVFTSSSYSIPTGTGWKEVPFTTNFNWNGTDNVVVFVEWDRSSTPTGDISWGRSTESSTSNATRVGSTSLAALVMLVNANRPVVQFTFSGAAAPVASVAVATQGNVPPLIAINGGILQTVANILPIGANQNVTWSITPGTGLASISSTGLVSAQANGTVWAKATSVADSTKMDSLEITISNQIVPVTGISLSTQGNVPPLISTNAGSLQINASILPIGANQNVTWSIVAGSGTASISASGLVSALTNGTVWAKAISVENNAIKDSLEITISNQIIPVTGIAVATQGNVPATITTNGGSLQMLATILPSNADQNVTWSIVAGSGTASISASGLVSALTNGDVWAKAISIIDNTKMDSVKIEISNQGVGILSQETMSKFNVYPNPVNDGLFYVQLKSSYNFMNTINYSLIDMHGRVILSGLLNQNNNSINISQFASGVYILNIQGENTIEQITIVKN